MANTERRGWHR